MNKEQIEIKRSLLPINETESHKYTCSVFKKGWSFCRCFSLTRLSLIMLVVFALLMTSCVYYNTVYNAEKYFASAQEQPLRDTGRPGPRAIQDYDKVIERCTYILKEHSDSKWADNALYLLARSMYYKKQSPLQAKERFQDLLRIFPESEFAPYALIYIAKIDYEMKDKREAHRRLQEILDNAEYRELHPEVLLLKGTFYLDDNDYGRAQENLQNIIERFPKSQQFELAFFTLGLAHLENENYTQSKEVFEILLESRAARRTKLNSRYYIALNHFHLLEYDEALDILQSLLKQEYEQENIPRLNLLKARCFAGIGEYEEAESLFKTVIDVNKRTLISAEACYHLAEMFFLELLDYEKAITYYNQIQAEFRASPFVEKGVARSAVVSQIVQFSREDRSISTADLINEQFKLAEYYLYVMNMPDSSLSVYNSVKKQKLRLQKDLDSLKTRYEKLIDNKSFEATELQEVTFREEEPVETEEVVIDSLNITEIESDIASMEEDLMLYQKEFSPYSEFSTAWIWLNVKNDQTKAEEVYNRMLEHYPENRYTYATEALLEGKEVRFATPLELQMEKNYEAAVEKLEKAPEDAIYLLSSIKDELTKIFLDNSRYNSQGLEKIYYKTLFSLGYAYYFQIGDSLSAKPYFDDLLQEKGDSEYSQFINRFYQNNKFIVEDSFDVLREESKDDPTKPEESSERSESGEYIDDLISEEEEGVEFVPDPGPKSPETGKD